VNDNRRVRDMLIVVLILTTFFGMLMLWARPANAEQPECTGDRHYDGVGCCPSVETTTTTLPGDVSECPSCPLPAPCPTVTCNDGADGTTTIVEVDRCPEYNAPNYIPCRRTKSGKLKCPRPRAPRRVLVPQSASAY